jgi:hypothetical protein
MSSFSVKKDSNFIVASPGNTPTYWSQLSGNIYNNNTPNNVGINTTTPSYDIDVSGDTNSFLYCVSGIPQQNLYLPAPQTSTVNNSVSAWANRNVGLSEASFNAMAWSPTLNTFVAIAQQGRESRIVISNDGGLTWPIRVTGIDLSNVTQVNLTGCNNGIGNIITCSNATNLISGALISSTFVTSVLDASSFVTNALIPGLSNASLSTTSFTCTDTSGLILGMNVSLVSGVGSTGGRTIVAIDPSSNTKFALSTTRNYSGSFCRADRSYFSLIWCSDLSGVGQFVGGAVSSSSQQILTSSDASGWVRRDTPLGYNVMSSFAYSPTLKRVVAATGTTGFLYSNDGINWIGVPNPLPTVSVNRVEWSPLLSRFVAITSATSNIYTSSDGITWTVTTSTTFPLLDFSSLVWSQELGIFCAISASNIGGKNVAISTNGIDWEAYSTPELNFFRNLIWSPELGIFAAIASSGINRFVYSYNGKTWFGRALPINLGYRAIAWSPQLRIFAIASADATSTNAAAVTTNAATYNIVLNSPTNLPSLLYVPTVLGVPSTPSVISNTVPIVYDTSNNRLYSYNGGTWRFLQFP